MGSIATLPGNLSSSATSLTEDQKSAARCRSRARWSMRARARAVMGNHELNALLYHTKGPDGEWLRPHNEKNTSLHQATLDQIALPCPAEWEDRLDWMLQLPLWLDLGSCRVVHAAWDDAAVQACGTRDTLAEITLGKAGRRQTPEGGAVNWLLKGPEYKLGDGAVFVDKEGFTKEICASKMVDSHPTRHDSCRSRNAGWQNSRQGRRSCGVAFPGYSRERSQPYFRPLLVDPRGQQEAFGFKHRVPGLQRRLRRTTGRLSIRRRSKS